jgi:Ca-activated chloride channel family protein
MGGTGMRVFALTFSVLLLAGFARAASPGGVPDPPLTTYRVEAAEVHVAFSAIDNHQRPVTELSTSDFTLLRDGRPVEQAVELERRHESPIVAAVMTDVSASMAKALPLARDSWQWMNTNLLRGDDQIAYFDFGAELSSATSPQQPEMHLTSFYDCLLKLIPKIKHDGYGRRAIILFTDGGDNDSIHSLQDVINQAVEQDIAVYAITTWKFKIWYDEPGLDQLTSSTGGRYFVIKDTKEMISALQDITQELRNGYEVVFRAGKARSGMHRIAIQPTNRRLRFYCRGAYFQPTASGNAPTYMALER